MWFPSELETVIGQSGENFTNKNLPYICFVCLKGHKCSALQCAVDDLVAVLIFLAYSQPGGCANVFS